jgi:hypothetical protein
MTHSTHQSRYLLSQEHITDKEINELYDFASELKLQLDGFQEYDKKYRSLENVSTGKSEQERTDILNACMLIIQNLTTILENMRNRSSAISDLLIKAKGALEEKLDAEGK